MVRRTFTDVLPLGESLVSIPVVILQVGMLHLEDTVKLLGSSKASENMQQALPFLCVYASLAIQGGKLVCAVGVFCEPSRLRFLHGVLWHANLLGAVWFLAIGVFFIFLLGLNVIALCSIVMVFSSLWYLLQKRYAWLWLSRIGNTTKVEDDRKNFTWQVLAYSSELERFGTTCPICMEDFEHGITVRQLRCNHIFHVACVDHWCRVHRSCPLRCKVTEEASWKPSSSAGMSSGDSHTQEAHEQLQHEQQQQQQCTFRCITTNEQQGDHEPCWLFSTPFCQDACRVQHTDSRVSS
mmetsp:Transcript_78334/g.155185  ORF Transcript_78334/g.155185 Transcript_78334/m.155185 type:complete len:295 (+) Transcript_78334:91-975(+)